MSKKELVNLLLILLLLLFIGALAFFLLKDESVDEVVSNKWLGEWEIIYHYENTNHLLYSGSLYLHDEDGLRGHLEVFPPAGRRSEKIQLQDLNLSDDGRNIKAVLVHDEYKIRGGYIRENFELKLNNDSQFQGIGQCLNFCAEGTEGVKIIWQGKKIKAI